MSQPSTTKTEPTLGHIHVITLDGPAKASFDRIIESVAGKVALDAANEQAVLIRHPLPQEYPWNGLVAFEKFGPDQIPHIHFPDPRKRDSSERYLLLSPTSRDSSVFIAPPDAPHKGEKILFEPGKLYLLHFDGGMLHKNVRGNRASRYGAGEKLWRPAMEIEPNF